MESQSYRVRYLMNGKEYPLSHVDFRNLCKEIIYYPVTHPTHGEGIATYAFPSGWTDFWCFSGDGWKIVEGYANGQLPLHKWRATGQLPSYWNTDPRSC